MTESSKKIIETYFSERADLIKTKVVKNGVIFFWKSAESIPSIRAVSFVENDTRKEFFPCENIQEFDDFLSTVSLSDMSADEISEIIQWSSPYLVRPIKKLTPYLESIKSEWQPPEKLGKNGFQGYFDNATEGFVEKISIKNNGTIYINRVCKGLKL